MTGKIAPQSGSSQDPSTDAKARGQLQGWIPDLATPEEIRSALDKAFDYRGDVTLTLRSGEKIEGYIFDRKSDGTSLDRCMVRMFPKDRGEKVLIRYSDIERLEFTGRDTAAGKSFELWVKRYNERKALGEKRISLEPEPLD
ncbi:MAG TPA: hypothetical protein VE398_10900 [Acidobacteriota bacterium]|nr:hypothetical protein [Acidobacteriota bacterium]